MFTPEFSSEDRGGFVLVANHALGTPEQVALSIAYNKARIVFGRSHVPASLRNCRLVYDVRGQDVPESVFANIRERLTDVEVEFMR